MFQHIPPFAGSLAVIIAYKTSLFCASELILANNNYISLTPENNKLAVIHTMLVIFLSNGRFYRSHTIKISFPFLLLLLHSGKRDCCAKKLCSGWIIGWVFGQSAPIGKKQEANNLQITSSFAGELDQKAHYKGNGLHTVQRHAAWYGGIEEEFLIIIQLRGKFP